MQEEKKKRKADAQAAKAEEQARKEAEQAKLTPKPDDAEATQHEDATKMDVD